MTKKETVAQESHLVTLSPCHRVKFRRKLLAWYRRHARDLPWRHTRDPYRVWVSEVMLQQTQVATVTPYYERFVARFPDVASLAAADEHDVLRHWEGLGYYRRARQMHQAVRLIAAEHDGQFPREPDALRRLPGIGRYTAGAILSIAFDAREPILEGNTQRLLSRILGHRGDPRSSAGQRLLWSAAAALLPRGGVGTFNQAMMELGSLICTPRTPRCDVCPVVKWCRAAQLSLQDKLPSLSARPRVELVHQAAIVVVRRGKVLLVKRTEQERWAGMWDFPRFEVADGSPRVLVDVAEELQAELGVQVEIGPKLATLKHTVTRFRIRLDCYLANCAAARLGHPAQRIKWASLHELAQLAMNSTGRKLALLIPSFVYPNPDTPSA